MKRTVTTAVLALLLPCLLTVAPGAQAAPITFEGLDVDVDLTGVTVQDVTFTYDDGGSGALAFIGPYGVREGNFVLAGETIGLLTLDFAVPTTSLGFDFWLDAAGDVTDGVLAELYAPNGDFIDVSTAKALYDDEIGLAQGAFLYEGAPISQALLLFDISDSTGFLLDNVATQPVPEPGSLLLLASGLAGLAGWGRRKGRGR